MNSQITSFYIALLVLWNSAPLLASSPLSRGLLEANISIIAQCAIAISDTLLAPDATWRSSTADEAASRNQALQLINETLGSDRRCTCAAWTNATESLVPNKSTSWQQQPPDLVGSGGGEEASSGMSDGALAALVISLVAGVLLAGLLVVLLLRLRTRHRDLLGRVVAPRAGQDTTLLISDVQSSTALWEQLPVTVMDAALRIHHETVRNLLPQYDGYESATEGDSFILAFADPARAVAFAAACQVELMFQEWPQELLEHPDAEPVLVDPQDGEVAQQAAVPGADGRRLGSRPPLPRSLLARFISSPASFIAARVRVAVAVLRGAPVAPTGPSQVAPLRSPYGGVGSSMYDMSVVDMSVYGSGFLAGLRRGVDASVRPAGGGATPTPSVVQVGPPGGAASASAGVDTKAQLTLVTAVSATTADASGGGGGSDADPGGRNPLPTKTVAFQDLPASPRLPEGPLAIDAADADADSATGRKMFVTRDRRPGAAAPSPLPVLMPSPAAPWALRPSSPWGAALQSAFLPVPLQEAPISVLTAQELKSPWVLLPSGRLVLVAYRGLRVRMGIHTGLDDPQYVAFNKVGSAYKYYGPFAETAKCATEAAPGGMVVLSGQAFARLRNCITAPKSATARGGRHSNLDAVVLYAGHHVTKAAAPSGKPPPPPPPRPRPAAPQLSMRISSRGGSGSGMTGGEQGPGAAVAGEGVALYEAVPAALVCRLALSQPLVSARTVQVGSLAAPTGCVTVAFMYVVGAATLLTELPGPAARALDQFQRLVCRLLGSKGGYLVEGGDGLVLAAFGNPTAAVEWALDCVAGLKKLDWEYELLNHWLCEEVLSVGLAGGDGLADPEVPETLTTTTLTTMTTTTASPITMMTTTTTTTAVLAGSRRASGAGFTGGSRRGISLGAASDCSRRSVAAGDTGSRRCTSAGAAGAFGAAAATAAAAVTTRSSGGGGDGTEGAGTDGGAEDVLGPLGNGSVSTVHSCAAPLFSVNSRRSLRRALSKLPSMAQLGARATTTRVLERGLRIKVGLDAGPASHSLNEASGRLSYRGKVMNRASRVAGKAAAGQVLCTDIVWRGCLEGPTFAGTDLDGYGSDSEPGFGLVGMSLGRVTLRGVSQPVEVIQCMRAS